MSSFWSDDLISPEKRQDFKTAGLVALVITGVVGCHLSMRSPSKVVGRLNLGTNNVEFVEGKAYAGISKCKVNVNESEIMSYYFDSKGKSFIYDNKRVSYEEIRGPYFLTPTSAIQRVENELK